MPPACGVNTTYPEVSETQLRVCVPTPETPVAVVAAMLASWARVMIVGSAMSWMPKSAVALAPTVTLPTREATPVPLQVTTGSTVTL